MFELIRGHQLNIMLGLSSICMVIGFFALLTKSLPKRRKMALTDLEFSASILLFSDRLAYIYHGNHESIGFWMVRITNFLVFFMTISVIHGLNLYLVDLCRNEIGLEKVPMRLRIVEIITGIGWAMVIISQFTGLYYYFDENNVYHRGPGFLICYVIPFLALFIQLSVILQYVKRMSLSISIPMILFSVVPLMASVCQAFYYGVSLTNMTIVGMGIVLYVFAILEMNQKLEQAQKNALFEAQNESRSVRRSFEQVMQAIVNGLDAKDKYTRGHSMRVAEYARLIAETRGMEKSECLRVYYAAALHDIGKIQLPDFVTEKQGRLTEAEELVLKTCPVIGGEILSEVEEMPYVKTAVLYQHERYDGKGYPDGLKGEDIPLYARIISVANAYDRLTSYTCERAPLAQGRVRELMLGGSGREFDPKLVKIMVDMIDRDTEYMMREPDEESVEEAERNDISVVKRMHFEQYKEVVSDGIRLSKEYLKIRFETRPDQGYERKTSLPAIILFDSFDRCVHRNERNIRNLHYAEFGEIWMDGNKICTAAREIKTDITQKESMDQISEKEWIGYEIEAVCIGDHVKIKIGSRYQFVDVTVALADSTRFVFLGMTGEHCTIRNISMTKMSLAMDQDHIERIAPEVNYFTRKDGDIPNVEVDGYRDASSQGMPVEDGMRLFFHTRSLPEARLVHHCAYILLYYSDDGTIDGKNYQEYACIRMDGDDATVNPKAKNELIIQKDEDFAGWDDWKEANKAGLYYEVDFLRKKNKITFITENAGLALECHTTVPKEADCVYVALTGNLCVLMDIRIR